jgi:hypothetical protein
MSTTSSILNRPPLGTPQGDAEAPSSSNLGGRPVVNLGEMIQDQGVNTPESLQKLAADCKARYDSRFNLTLGLIFAGVLLTAIAVGVVAGIFLHPAACLIAIPVAILTFFATAKIYRVITSAAPPEHILLKKAADDIVMGDIVNLAFMRFSNSEAQGKQVTMDNLLEVHQQYRDQIGRA